MFSCREHHHPSQIPRFSFRALDQAIEWRFQTAFELGARLGWVRQERILVKRELVVGLLLSATASAAPVGIEYTCFDERCPDLSTLRALVAARLGTDPFVEGAESVVHVVIIGSGPFHAEVSLKTSAGSRRKTVSDDDCVALAQNVAVIIALAVDPLMRKPSPRPVVTAQPPTVEAAPPAFDLKWGITLGASLNGGLSVGAQPQLRLEVRARHDLWSLGIEGRFAWPIAGAVVGATLTTAAGLGAIVPCFHWKWLAGCLDATIGVLRVEGSNVANASGASVLHGAAGLRVSFTVPITPHLGFGLLAEGNVPLTRTSAFLATSPGFSQVWVVSFIGGGVGALLSIVL